MKRIVTTLFVMSICLWVGTVHAEDVSGRLSRLEGRIDALERANIDRGSNIASAVSRAEAIQTEFAAVKGAVDSNTHLINATNNQMQTLYRDLERRIQNVEDQLQLIQNMLKKGLHSAAPNKATDEYLTYQAAMEKMNDGDYLNAAALFQEFIKYYPRSRMAAESQFKTGECYFFAKDYKQAIKQYQVFIERYPRNKNVGQALVMQGTSFAELDMKDEAKAFFTKVMRDYPDTGAAQQAKAKIDLLEGRSSLTAQNHKSEQPANLATDYPQETIEQQRAKEKQGVTPAPVPQQVAPKTAPKQEKRRYMEF